MNPEDTNIECGNNIKRYSQRPHILDNYCLADYTSKLNVIYPKEFKDLYEDNYEDDPFYMHNDKETDSDLDTQKTPQNVTLKSGIQIQSCSTSKVIRFVNYNQKTDAENHYRERIMLYIPWRNKSLDILQKENSFEKSFLKNRARIEAKMNEYEPQKVLQINELAEMFLEDRTVDEMSQIVPCTEQTEQEDRMQDLQNVTN